MFALRLLTYNYTNLPQPTETSIEEEMEQIAVGFNLVYSVPRSNNSRILVKAFVSIGGELPKKGSIPDFILSLPLTQFLRATRHECN
jgi:hypothetical protein